MRMPEMPMWEKVERIYSDSYRSEVGLMNRAERRTTKGKQRVIQAEVNALKAQNEFLKSQMDEV